MKKVIKILTMTFIILVFFSIPQFTFGFYFDLISFSANKNDYFSYENIEINAEWELFYDNEVSFIQVQIFDNSNNLIWFSDEINNQGYNSRFWLIYIPDLNLKFDNNSTFLSVKFYHLIDDGEKIIGTFRESFNLTIIKPILTCEMYGFKNSILYGKNISFSMKFYETGNNTSLNNESVNLKIKNNNITTLKYLFTTNQSGFINVNLSSLYELQIGINLLEFIINDSDIYEQSCFSFKLEVKKIPILAEIVRCESNFMDGIDIELYYSYRFDGYNVNLSNKTISINIYQNKSIIKEIISNTDINGSLYLNISYNSIHLIPNHPKLKIEFFFNGSCYLDNKSLDLTLEIEMPNFPENSNMIEILSISSLLTSALCFGLIIINKKKSKEKHLSDLYVKI